MSGMEKFYARKYADSLFYYELRLPHPVHLNASLKESEILALWKKLRPKEIFKQHADETDPAKIRKYLVAISGVQYKEESYLSKRQDCLDFLGTYFAGQVIPSIGDIVLLQKELGMYIAPPNKRAIARTPADYVPSNNVPKKRSVVDYQIEELEGTRQKLPFLLEDLEIND
jgi:hypothetical protein